jgi:hypothetical protein
LSASATKTLGDLKKSAGSTIGPDGLADVTPDDARLVLGGTITNQRVLLAGDSVTADFTIDVNY